MFAWEELSLDSASPRMQPRQPVCFPASSVVSGEVFPQPLGRGAERKMLSPVDFASPLLNVPMSEDIKFSLSYLETQEGGCIQKTYQMSTRGPLKEVN